MAPFTLGTFLRAFTFGDVRQLEAVAAEALRRAWAAGAGPGLGRLVIDVDSTITEVVGKAKQGAAYGYTKVLGYHPLFASRADTGELLQARLRRGSANTARGARRFIEELVARVRRAGAGGEIVLRMDSGFWSKETISTLRRLDVRYTMTVRTGNRAISARHLVHSRGRLGGHRLHRRWGRPGGRDHLQGPSTRRSAHPADRPLPGPVVAGRTRSGWRAKRPARRRG